MTEDELYERIWKLEKEKNNTLDKLEWVIDYLRKTHITVDEYKKIIEKVEEKKDDK